MIINADSAVVPIDAHPMGVEALPRFEFWTMEVPLTKKDLQMVHSDVFNAAVKWYDLGLALGLVSDELDKIQYDDVDNCLRDMLKRWLSKCLLKPTRRALINALQERTVGEEALAEDLVKKYRGENLTQQSRSESVHGPSHHHGQLQTTAGSQNSISSAHSLESSSFKRPSTSNESPDPKRKVSLHVHDVYVWILYANVAVSHGVMHQKISAILMHSSAP